MKILIVCNNVYKRGNGVSSAVLSLQSRLVEMGLEVRMLTCENPDRHSAQPEYPLKHFVFPLVEPIISSNGYRFPKIDRAMIEKAVEWADVIHLMEGFPLQKEAARVAERLGKPCVGTYHTFTENITVNLGLGSDTFLNRLINRWWRTSVYDHCRYIQCPTMTVKTHLEENGYASSLRVISNGVSLSSPAKDAPAASVPPYRILCVGRLSNEKSQMTLIKAMRHSKYAHEIELHFAGNGPKANKIKKAAQKLFANGIVGFEPVFAFYTHEELISLSRISYLYIHCATIEVEGLSCLEAIRQGLVPVIANAKLSATSQFALDEHSIFPASNPKALAERIDWWIEHPEERAAMSRKYAESARRYDIRESTKQIIRMYEDAAAYK